MRWLATVCWSLVVALGGVGCTGATSGTPVSTEPGASAATIAQATTFERDGLRVLWNGPARGRWSDEERAFAAENQADLDRLWEAVGTDRPAPPVDFARETVFAVSGLGGECPDEVTGVRIDSRGLLRLTTTPWTGSCPDVRTSVATVIAVPRRLLPADVTIASLRKPDRAFRFELGSVRDPRSSAPAVEQSAMSEPLAASEPLGEATIPPRGHMALARLEDGTEVWLVHDRTGALTVLSAAVATRDTSYFGVRGEWEDALFVAPGWDPATGRFWGGYDAHGRNVHGWPPMPRHRFTRSSADRVRVQGKIAPETGPILPALAAPVLDGTRAPYAHAGRRVLTSFTDIAEGRLELLAMDVVWGLSGRARLCRAPAADASSLTPSDPPERRFTGCPAHAPIIASSSSKDRRATKVLEGPVLTRRLGPALAEVVVVGNPTLRVISPNHAVRVHHGHPPDQRPQP